MEARKFTWFPKLTDTLQELAQDFPDQVGEFAIAVTQYGTYGIEPEFKNIALKYAFLGIKEDIDNSVNARFKNSGGRPKTKTPDKTPVSKIETPVTESVTPVSKIETPVMGNEEGFCNTETPLTVNHTNPYQSIPSHSKPVSDRRTCVRFTPPQVEEVEKYARERGTPIDAEAFVDFYASKGWKVGSNPMKDWKAAVRNWGRRDRNGPSVQGKGVSSEYAGY